MKLLASGALALVLVSAAVAQQPSQPAVATVSEYIVQPGDNLWKLAQLRLNNPERWHELVEQNPFLQDPSRVHPLQGGGVDIRINEGEHLRGLTADEVASLGAPIRQVAEERGSAGPAQVEPNFFERNLGWLALLLVLIVAAVVAYLLWRRRQYHDPVGAGQPMVRGGLTDSSALQRFERRSGEQHFTIRSIERGQGYGEMMVSYKGGREEPRLLNGETVYLAIVRFEGRDADEQIYMLQGCGNDVRYGNRNRPGREFRFVSDTVVHQAPEPTPEPEAVAPAPAPEPEPEPVPAPASVAEAIPPVVQAEDELKIELKPAEEAGGTAMVRITGAPTNDMVLTVGNDSLTLRFHPKG